MGKRYEVDFVPRGSASFEVEAASEDAAISRAWAMFRQTEPDAEWDVDQVQRVDVDEEEEEEVSDG